MTPTTRPRVLIAEDHTLVREALRLPLSEEFDVVDAVADGKALLGVVVRVPADAVVLDISMPQLTGIEAARQIVRLCPGLRLVFVTNHVDATYVEAAFKAGGHAYVAKHEAASHLVAAVQAVLAGRRYVSPPFDKRGQVSAP